MEYVDFVEKCIKEYQENENEFIYRLIDPFCETVVEKTLSKKELKEILLKGMQKSNLLDKVKQAREEIENIGKDIYTDAAETKCEVLAILDRLISEVEE